MNRRYGIFSACTVASVCRAIHAYELMFAVNANDAAADIIDRSHRSFSQALTLHEG